MGGLQVYGVVPTTANVDFRGWGGEGAGAVHTVLYDGLACIVGESDGQALGALPKEQLVRRLLAYQQVVEQVIGKATVLPVRFGTVLASADEVRQFLAHGRGTLAAALAMTEGKVEIEVAAIWDPGRVLQQIAQEEEVVRAREALNRGSQPTVAERIQLGQLVKARMDRRRDAYRARIVEWLRPLAVDVAANALVSEQMVMNVAFLVEKARQEEFDARVRELDAFLDGEVNFRLVGPLPPYTFSTVEVRRVSAEELSEARQMLQLGPSLSETQVRRAYRHQAAEAQRHPRPGDERAAGRLARLRQACGLLVDYCRARAEAGGGEETSRLQEVGEGPVFLIAVKRSRSDEVEPARFGVGERE